MEVQINPWTAEWVISCLVTHNCSVTYKTAWKGRRTLRDCKWVPSYIIARIVILPLIFLTPWVVSRVPKFVMHAFCHFIIIFLTLNLANLYSISILRDCLYNHFPFPTVNILCVPRRCFFCGSFLLFMFHFCLCYTVWSVPCSLVNTCWKRTDLLFCCVVWIFVFMSLSHMVFRVRCGAWSIPDICLPLFFKF